MLSESGWTPSGENVMSEENVRLVLPAIVASQLRPAPLSMSLVQRHESSNGWLFAIVLYTVE